VLTAPAHLNPDIFIWRGMQLGSNGIRHYSNTQHGGVMGLLLYQPLSHRPIARITYKIVDMYKLRNKNLLSLYSTLCSMN
jgi:hypothetical protein